VNNFQQWLFGVPEYEPEIDVHNEKSATTVLELVKSAFDTEKNQRNRLLEARKLTLGALSIVIGGVVLLAKESASHSPKMSWNGYALLWLSATTFTLCIAAIVVTLYYLMSTEDRIRRRILALGKFFDVMSRRRKFKHRFKLAKRIWLKRYTPMHYNPSHSVVLPDTLENEPSVTDQLLGYSKPTIEGIWALNLETETINLRRRNTLLSSRVSNAKKALLVAFCMLIVSWLPFALALHMVIPEKDDEEGQQNQIQKVQVICCHPSACLCGVRQQIPNKPDIWPFYGTN